MAPGGFSDTRLTRIRERMQRYVHDGVLPGIITGFCRHGEIHVDTFGVRDVATGAPLQRDTILRISSMSKPVIAVGALILVEETVLRLDDPVDLWLPELANRRVLRSIESRIDDTVPANRPITLRDLLTHLPGFGAIMAPSGTYPIQAALSDAGLDLGPSTPPGSPDDFMARLGSVPNAHQPGERWMYHTAFDVLGILIERATGRELGTFLRERIFDTLGMRDTGFSVPAAHLDRLATSYHHVDGDFAVFDEAKGGLWANPPAFRSGAGGLVSTVDDYLAFGRMLLGHGVSHSVRILSRPSVELMISDQITPEQKAASPFYPNFWDATGWGLGVGIATRRTDTTSSPGSYGWDGGLGTSWRTDPAEGLTGVALTQLVDGGPEGTNYRRDFWTLAYAAIED